MLYMVGHMHMEQMIQDLPPDADGEVDQHGQVTHPKKKNSWGLELAMDENSMRDLTLVARNLLTGFVSTDAALQDCGRCLCN